MSTMWHQSDLMDEVEPTGFATIEEHLGRDPAGNLMLADFYGEYTKPTQDGQIIHFERHEDIGTSQLTIGDGWTWEITPPPPEEYSSCTGDNGLVEGAWATTLEQLIEQWYDEGGTTLEDLQDMEITFWRITQETRRVDAATGTLVPVELEAKP